jgi:SPP1 family predicted phage head-tail adaptor
MDFSKLDQLIAIKQPSTAVDDLGEATPSWTTLVECYSHQSNKPGKEYFQAARVFNESHDYFLIRPRTGITPLMRVFTSDGNEFEITDIWKSDRRGESMTLVTKRVR